MCGFLGFMDSIDHKEDILTNMMNQIIHRGPDGDGQYCDEDVALGFRRLSIIDLEGGSQPIYNEDDSMVLVFNGEIYNYKQLREKLINKGHTFSTHSDSEVLIHGYEEYGTKLPDMLRGMFAFCIYDKRNKRLFGARDYFGIKPFYYANMGESFIFGSEIKSFLPHPNFQKKLNVNALDDYLSFQYTPLDMTFFEGVHKLMPAHYMIYEDNTLTIKRYWQAKFETEKKSLDEDVNTIDQTFNNSVEAHHIADVEVGCFLSSGIDSSYVASRFKGSKTFTVGFENEHYNETDYAKQLSALLETDHHIKVISPKEYWNVLPKVQYHMDEPLADPSAIALYFVSELASKHVKVVLSGEGADELFGGYNIYQEPLAVAPYQKLPEGFRRFVGDIAKKLPDIKGKNYLIRGSKNIEERFIGNAYIFTKEEREKVLNVAPIHSVAPSTITKTYYDKVKGEEDITKMQFLDLHMWLAGDILLKADKMSMCHSLELRVPFLDKELFNVARKLPLEHRVTKNQTKHALRIAANRSLPDQWAKKKKLGFPVPLATWLRQEDYYKEVYNEFNSQAASKYFNPTALNKLLDDHYNSRKDNARKIWCVYMFLVWYKVYFEDFKFNVK